jgi:multicomponent K+:H+ antiporter subunit D
MNHWMIFPILIPAVMAPLIVLTARFDQILARVFSVSGTFLMLLISGVLYSQSASGTVTEYELGQWPSPFGIVLVLDRLSATMLVLSGLLGFVISMATIDGWDQRGRNFHALLLMQLGGINGAFLTGDLFNLFVFFEVMLIASYGLMVHGGGALRLRAGIQFVVINLCGSTLFLAALALIYAATGDLNMHELGIKLSQMPESNRAVMSCGIALLMIVFGVKAALVPLHFWLPVAYGFAPPMVAALFAIATKVGAYCMIRIHSSILDGNEELLSFWTTGWLLPAGLATIVVGMVGVLASRSLAQMASYATLASSGTIIASLSLFNANAFGSAMYYLIHSTLAGAAMFLLVDAVSQRRGKHSDRLIVAPQMPHVGLLGGLFMLTAIAVTGLPPLSGFVGKVMILTSVYESSWAGAIWLVVISTSLFGILGFARAGSTLFWKSSQQTDQDEMESTFNSTPLTLIACGILLVALISLTIGAGSTYDSLLSAASQLWNF